MLDLSTENRRRKNRSLGPTGHKLGHDTKDLFSLVGLLVVAGVASTLILFS